MKKMLLFALLASTALGQAPETDVAKIGADTVATCQAKINRAFQDGVKAGGNDDTVGAQRAMLLKMPRIAACNKENWPDTAECSAVARVVAHGILMELKETK